MFLTYHQERVNKYCLTMESRSRFKLVIDFAHLGVFGDIAKIIRKVTKIIQMLQEKGNFLLVK